MDPAPMAHTCRIFSQDSRARPTPSATPRGPRCRRQTRPRRRGTYRRSCRGLVDAGSEVRGLSEGGVGVGREAVLGETEAEGGG
ncbi:unnamed protein product [Musa hybrid cultivar]